MWNDRIDMMALVQDCLLSKNRSNTGAITDTLIAKGYHRCDEDERKKMDAVDRKADELATMRLRERSLRDVQKQFMVWGDQFEEGTPQRKHYYEISLTLGSIAGEYAGLKALIEAKYGVSE